MRGKIIFSSEEEEGGGFSQRRQDKIDGRVRAQARDTIARHKSREHSFSTLAAVGKIFCQLPLCDLCFIHQVKFKNKAKQKTNPTQVLSWLVVLGPYSSTFGSLDQSKATERKGLPG